MSITIGSSEIMIAGGIYTIASGSSLGWVFFGLGVVCAFCKFAIQFQKEQKAANDLENATSKLIKDFFDVLGQSASKAASSKFDDIDYTKVN